MAKTAPAPPRRDPHEPPPEAVLVDADAFLTDPGNLTVPAPGVDVPSGYDRLGLALAGTAPVARWTGPVPDVLAERLERIGEWSRAVDARLDVIDAAHRTGTLDTALPREPGDRRRPATRHAEGRGELVESRSVLAQAYAAYERATDRVCELAALAAERTGLDGPVGDGARALLYHWASTFEPLLEDIAIQAVRPVDEQVLGCGDLGWFVVHGH